MRVGFLRSLYEGARPPYLTVWLETSRQTADAGHQMRLRFRAVRERLAEAGTEPRLLDELDERVGPAPMPGLQSQLLVADSQGVRMSEYLPTRAAPPIATRSPLPHLLPWLAARTLAARYLLVLIDRRGARVTAHLFPGRQESVEVTGEEYPVEKNAPGGWSQRRYQAAADETWEHNAKMVAETVVRERREHNPELVIVSGDQRARSLLLEHVDDRTRDIATDIGDIGPTEGASRESLASRVRDAVADRVEAGVDKVARRYEEARASDGWGVEGVGDVLAALTAGQVETLLIDRPEIAPERLAWVGPDPTPVAEHRDEMTGVEPTDLTRDRIDAALIRALAATDGDLVWVAPDRLPLRDGIGAVLRYPKPARRAEVRTP